MGKKMSHGSISFSLLHVLYLSNGMMHAFSFTNHMNLISIINVGFNIRFRINIDQDAINDSNIPGYTAIKTAEVLNVNGCTILMNTTNQDM